MSKRTYINHTISVNMLISVYHLFTMFTGNWLICVAGIQNKMHVAIFIENKTLDFVLESEEYEKFKVLFTMFSQKIAPKISLIKIFSLLTITIHL